MEESKEMEYLKDIKYLVLNEIDNLKNKELWKSYFDKLEQSLIELQQIKSAEPSEAMKCLENLADYYDINYDSDDERYQTIKQSLMSKSNAEIVLDNLKKKFKFEVNDYVKRIVIYSEEDQYAVQHTISDEEYDLFNKWLENEDLQPQKSNAERCWEIVVKKQVDMGWLWYCIHELVNSLNEYNKKMPIEKFKLTEEEFDKLKCEVGKCQK